MNKYDRMIIRLELKCFVLCLAGFIVDFFTAYIAQLCTDKYIKNIASQVDIIFICNMANIQTIVFLYFIPTIFLFITGFMTIHYYDKYFIKFHKKSNSMKILLTLFNAILSFALSYLGCRLAFGLALVKAMQNF